MWMKLSLKLSRCMALLLIDVVSCRIDFAYDIFATGSSTHNTPVRDIWRLRVYLLQAIFFTDEEFDPITNSDTGKVQDSLLPGSMRDEMTLSARDANANLGDSVNELPKSMPTGEFTLQH